MAILTAGGDGSDELSVEMLGAGQEVGRSCCVLKYKGKVVVCDAGVHPAFQGIAALPFIDELDWSTVDALLITHFHLDHAASLTYIMEKTNFRDGKGKVYMTHPTKAVYRFLMSDFVRMSNAGNDDNLFDETEMLASWRQIETVDYHQEVSVGGGFRFTPYHAGHVLGACMFLIEIAGLRILYTGDFSREEDRHLVQAEVPPVRPDVLISESTYGVQSLEPRLEKEERFTNSVHQIVQRGGRVLLPVFVLGRAQELLLLLDEYWSQHPELHSIPIYYASSLARKCISIYQTYIHTMNEHIRSRFNRRDNPFVFKHVSNLRSLEKFEDKGPCVMMASPGFMQSGVSRQLLERWAPDRRNGLIVTGYSVEGTMARNVIKEPDEILSLAGQKIPLRMSVDYISFSAHVDFTQNSRFIDEVKAQHIVLVHGEQSAMNRLKVALQNRFANRNEDVKVHTPRNCEVLKIKFKGERMAKAIGSIAEKPPKPDSFLDGLLISKDFAYTILDPKDLADFTGLNMSTIIQRQRISLHVAWSLARWHLEGMYGRIAEGVDLEGRRTMRIMDVLDIKQSATTRHELVLEWASSVANDMIADSAVALLLGIDSSPASVKITSQGHSHEHENGHNESAGDDQRLSSDHPHCSRSSTASLTRVEQLVAFLEAHFGEVEEVMVGKDDTSDDAEMEEPKQQQEVKQEQEGEITVKKEEDGDEVMSREEGERSNDTSVPAPMQEDTPLPSIESTITGPPRLALRVTLDRDSAILEPESLTVFSRSIALQARVEHLAKLAVQAQAPIADSFLLEPAITAELFQGGHVPPIEPASSSQALSVP
ncbi:Metallo-hydrolase/oxidoreductase [Acaromyces ingoldii]|uniref:Endoribonuclease YSH1 n=1 Tax=Acaromyces ingoldii TaxID=215250 RepID=A0A316YSF4_9BASI|nr:Metallo-hydrolase/oxidoreductase [Acaromyces ingoldii]PWN90943.1 Metallo-hydrolase/oxidoreductase [Acaromyces ingoldii]